MPRWKRPSVRTVLLSILVWIGSIGLLLLEAPDLLPHSIMRWLLLIVFGPPAFLIALALEELFGALFLGMDGIFRELPSKALPNPEPQKPNTLAMVLTMLIFALLIFAMLVVIHLLYNP